MDASIDMYSFGSCNVKHANKSGSGSAGFATFLSIWVVLFFLRGLSFSLFCVFLLFAFFPPSSMLERPPRQPACFSELLIFNFLLVFPSFFFSAFFMLSWARCLPNRSLPIGFVNFILLLFFLCLFWAFFVPKVVFLTASWFFAFSFFRAL